VHWPGILAGPFLLPATFRIASAKTMKRTLNKRKIAKNVANALAAVPIDNKQERDAVRAKLRRKYTDLKPLTGHERQRPSTI
jgi:hypothetical protein